MWGLVTVQLVIALLLLLLGWAIKKKKAYWLISGFASRPKEEQEQLIENGLPQKTGIMLIATAAGMLILLPLLFTFFIFAMEVQFGFMLLFLLGGSIFLSKYEVPRKRKRSFMINTILFVIVVGSLTALSVFSYQGYELIVKNDSFEITGMYGDEWNMEEIERVDLMEKMPEVTLRTNGVGLPTLSKGHFKVKNYGSSLLFIQNGSSPYIYIELKDRKIFINDKDPEQTQVWYEQLSKKAELIQ